MAEELTTKMHSEFSVSNDVEIKHRCFSVLKRLSNSTIDISKVVAIYNVTIEQVESHREEFELLIAK